MFPFSIRQLEVFLAVCESGSFHQAAERLRITQAGVSNHIRAIERQLDCELFLRRRGASARLSPNGERFRKRALEINALGSSFWPPTRTRKTILRLVVGDHLLATFVKPVLPDFYFQNPEVELEFVPFDNYSSFEEITNDQSIDCALVAWNNKGELLPNTEILPGVTAGVYALPELIKNVQSDHLFNIPIIVWPLVEGSDRKTLRYVDDLGVSRAFVSRRVQHFDDAIQLALRGYGAVLVRQSMIDEVDKGHKLMLMSRPTAWAQLLYLKPALKSIYRETLGNFMKMCATRTAAAG